MTLSRDIETLFDHFGGNAQDYQEIGRENEARTARTRWPLLVTLDLTQPSIPVIAQRREGVPAGAGGDAGDSPSKGPAASGQRGKLPLFARAHRRAIPPVENVTLPPAIPAGTLRFSAAPAPVASDAPAERAAAPDMVAAPAVPAGRAAGAPLQGSSAPAAAAHLPRTPSPAFAARPAAPAAPMTQPTPTTSPAPSILGKLFKAPEAPKPQQQAPAPQAAPVALTALFERLRGAPAPGIVPSAAAGKVAAPADNAWLVSGPRRP
ncbi:hypothetical protein P3T23_007972 [Paraburkholderia sp. GAS448]|uniref:cellulose biosynthesis protein BcsP n=1 Tax=Paraburkholderia sp. GAS448 TaxID=3035136 RepID=UPI003D206EC0